MTCPNCGAAVADNARFCPNCGFRFDEVRQVEPIRIDISQPAGGAAPNFLPPPIQPPIQPTVIVREKRSGATAAVVALTVLVTLLTVGALGLFAYYLLSRPAARDDRAAIDANVVNANLNIAAAPSPTTYEDLKNKLAPPEKRQSLIDEAFEVEPGAQRTIEFEVTDQKGARLVGGLRVTKGKAIDFVVMRGDVDGESTADELKPLVKEANTRNKIVNQRLKQNSYILIFDNTGAAPVNVAAELFLVAD